MKYSEDRFPMISCVMPVYNAGSYLDEAINSILCQSFTDFELLIIDDGSTDESLSIIKKYASTDERVIYKTRENRGLPYTLNELIEMSRGKYIARMDNDDISFKNRFKEQFEYMEKHSDVAVLGSNVVSIGFMKHIYFGNSHDDKLRPIRMLFYNFGVPHPTAFIRKQFLDDSMISYNPNNVAAEDYELWSDILSHGGIIHLLDTPLLYYRIHKGQMMDSLSVESIQNTRDIKAKQMRRVCDFTEEEIDCLYYMFQVSKEIDVCKMRDTLIKLISANKSSHTYDSDILEHEVAYQWVYAGLLRKKHNNDVRMLNHIYIREFIGFKHVWYVIWHFTRLYFSRALQSWRTFVNLNFLNTIKDI